LLPHIKKKDRPSAGEEPWPLAVYLDHIRSAHNVGSILRTVEAFSLGKVYFSSDTPYIDHSQVQKASMGTFDQVPCFRDSSVADLPKPVIALETSEDAISLYEFLFPGKFSLVIGNEEYGCSDEVLRKADYLVEIPLRGRKNSLNVANAFAIAAAEIAKQNRKKAPCKINRL
jgi:tRNA G18 (ribose-2'-O)-methylase SpoU